MPNTTTTTRDMTKQQFQAACKRRGFVHEFDGYYKLGDTGVSVAVQNAGPNRRARLAYLIQSHDDAVKHPTK